REEIEKHLGCKVYIDLWVRVKKEWRKHAKSFKELGYNI
ncbi:MAG: GTPase Era, partial [Candidatus Aerophobetes bacterium]|nr:GTPase Era [Candidatus Aerophobetes bacterium]